MTSLVIHIQVYLANSYCIWKNEFCFLNSNECKMFFPYYENYVSHNVKWYLLCFVRSQGPPPCLPTRQLSNADISAVLTAVACFGCEILKRNISWVVCWWGFFFPFLFFWLVWMPEYNLAHHQDILSWCWQVPSSVLLQDFCLGMRWENPTVSVSRWGCQVASARAAVDTVGDHQVGEESGSLFIAYLCNMTIEINAVGFFLRLFLNSGNVILTMNFRTSENLGFRNLTVGVFKRQ